MLLEDGTACCIASCCINSLRDTSPPRCICQPSSLSCHCSLHSPLPPSNTKALTGLLSSSKNAQVATTKTPPARQRLARGRPVEGVEGQSSIAFAATAAGRGRGSNKRGGGQCPAVNESGPREMSREFRIAAIVSSSN